MMVIEYIFVAMMGISIPFVNILVVMMVTQFPWVATFAKRWHWLSRPTYSAIASDDRDCDHVQFGDFSAEDSGGDPTQQRHLQ